MAELKDLRELITHTGGGTKKEEKTKTSTWIKRGKKISTKMYIVHNFPLKSVPPVSQFIPTAGVSPVLQMLSFDLGHLSTGEIKHLLTEQLQDDHVVLAEALTGAARAHNITDKCGPVFGPLLLQDL